MPYFGTCPKCDKEFSSTKCQRNVVSNIRQHLQAQHHMTVDAARKLLEDRGIARKGYPLDQAIADWDRTHQTP